MYTQIDFIGLYNVDKPINDPIDDVYIDTKERPEIMFSIVFSLKNGGSIRLNNKSIPIEKNTVICAKPGQKRKNCPPLKFYCINFDIENDELRNILFNLPDVLPVENPEEYRKIFVDAYNYFKTNSADCKIMLESLILKLIYCLKQDSETISNSMISLSKQTKIIKNAVKYIKENLNEDLSLEALAKRFSISPARFHSNFKKVMLKTPRVFVEERRIKKSITLLLTTNYSISEIAYECGFSSHSYFGYAFKRYTGMTPSDYVKNHKYD